MLQLVITKTSSLFLLHSYSIIYHCSYCYNITTYYSILQHIIAGSTITCYNMLQLVITKNIISVSIAQLYHDISLVLLLQHYNILQHIIAGSNITCYNMLQPVITNISSLFLLHSYIIIYHCSYCYNIATYYSLYIQLVATSYLFVFVNARCATRSMAPCT